MGNSFKNYDIHCPLMTTEGNPDGLNYWKEWCDYRQTLPDLKNTCFPYCKANNPSKPEQFLKLADEWQMLVDEGMTQARIAEKYGVSSSTIAKYTRGDNLKKTTVRFETRAPQWYKMYHKKHLSYRKIAALEDVSETTVRKYVRFEIVRKENNVKRRGKNPCGGSNTNPDQRAGTQSCRCMYKA